MNTLINHTQFIERDRTVEAIVPLNPHGYHWILLILKFTKGDVNIVSQTFDPERNINETLIKLDEPLDMVV